MVTYLNDNVKDNDDDDDIGYHHRDNMIAQFKQDLYNKSFSHQHQDKRDDSLKKRITFWLNYVVVNAGAQMQILSMIMIRTILKETFNFKRRGTIGRLKNIKNS